MESDSQSFDINYGRRRRKGNNARRDVKFVCIINISPKEPAFSSSYR
jgi:hypothetical protein